MRAYTPIFLVGIILSSLACDTNYRTPLPPERIDHVESVFVHGPKEYSLLVRFASIAALQTKHFVLSEPPMILDDVMPGDPMWAVYRRVDVVRRYQIDVREHRLELHVRSMRDLNSAGWKVERNLDAPCNGTMPTE